LTSGSETGVTLVSFEDSILDPTGTLVYVDATVDLPT
jgi:hypothetical protein